MVLYWQSNTHISSQQTYLPEEILLLRNILHFLYKCKPVHWDVAQWERRYYLSSCFFLIIKTKAYCLQILEIQNWFNDDDFKTTNN